MMNEKKTDRKKESCDEAVKIEFPRNVSSVGLFDSDEFCDRWNSRRLWRRNMTHVLKLDKQRHLVNIAVNFYA